jgi:hypothetical protein
LSAIPTASTNHYESGDSQPTLDVIRRLAIALTPEERAAAAERLSATLVSIDALNLPPMSDDDVAEEVQVARRERRARQGA